MKLHNRLPSSLRPGQRHKVSRGRFVLLEYSVTWNEIQAEAPCHAAESGARFSPGR